MVNEVINLLSVIVFGNTLYCTLNNLLNIINGILFFKV